VAARMALWLESIGSGMMLQIYNSLTGRKETFKPMRPGQVRMYVCGMTVYDYCHLGHARAMVVFDMVVRYLRSQGLEVTDVRTITEIDAKIIQRAAELGVDVNALTERFIVAMNEDAAALGVLPPDREPRATESIDGIVAMVETLIAKGYAYAADNGDVYYAVAKFDGYGKLSGEKLDDLRAGARIEVDEAKRDPLDFVLWKAAKPGEPSWPSPWGEGRPGWHIECSVMSTSCLGNHFDIHGGGLDLKFPHHENEIAQSEAATGETFVNVWMHNGHVRIDDEKMSKSLGNFFTVREILARYRPEQVRYFLLASHYRGPLNHSDEALDNAGSALERLYIALRGLKDGPVDPEAAPDYRRRFTEAMDDDFNTPVALAVLHDLAREINRGRSDDLAAVSRLGMVLRELGGVLGLLQEEPTAYLQASASGAPADDAEIESLILQRREARAARDFAEADRLRDELVARGIVIEDGPEGTSWRRA
jgi:cysteinyl-tRNA synthetase